MIELNGIQLDKISTVPLYEQLRKALLEAITSGKLSAGTKLPTEEELCAQFGISRPVARQAYNMLIEEGFVERMRGRGTFVRSPDTRGRFLNKQLSFAAGMAANVKMLAGSDAELKAVDFADGMDVEVFEKQLAEAIDSYADCEAVLVLADIAGGTPYNRAAGLSMTRPKVRVISGLNSSMLMDLCMRNITGDECPDVDALAADIMQTGHENIGKFVLEVPAQPQEDEDGI